MKPIIFTGPSLPASASGQKRQTRRVLDPAHIRKLAELVPTAPEEVSVTYPEFVERVAEKSGHTRKCVREVLAVVSAELLEEGVRERVLIPGLGTFSPRTRRAREVVDPRGTGERIHLPAQTTLGFRPTKPRPAEGVRHGGR